MSMRLYPQEDFEFLGKVYNKENALAKAWPYHFPKQNIKSSELLQLMDNITINWFYYDEEKLFEKMIEMDFYDKETVFFNSLIVALKEQQLLFDQL